MSRERKHMSESRTEVNETNVLEDIEMNVKLKLAGVWTSFMFLYIYVDYLTLYKPGILEDILAGRVFIFDITQTFVLAALILISIPTLMIFLSLALPAKVNRWLNIIVAIVYVPVSLFNVVGAGEYFLYYSYGAGVETVLLALVVWYAWKWPRTTGSSSDSETGSTTALT